MRAHPTPRGGVEVADARLPINVSAYPTRGILQPPVWTWEVPAYFFLGGLAAGSAMLSLAAELGGNEVVARRARSAAVLGLALSPPLLISDLGRPERFFNMLRVFRPTSPMNVGTWILNAFGAAASGAFVLDRLPFMAPLRRLASLAAAALAPPLATYTAVLVAQTSVPVWHQARRLLPFVFATSAVASGGAFTAATLDPEENGVARWLAVFGAVGELAATQVMERRLGKLADVYHEGPAAAYAKTALVASTAGAATLAVAGRSRIGSVVGSGCVLLGALSTRFAVWRAGRESAGRT